MPQVRVGSWGRLSNELHAVQALHRRAGLRLSASAASPALAYGNGRSYGDACLNPGGRLWTTRGLDRFIAFDTDTGQLEAEAGVLLGEIIAVALPRGWFLPVTPGTQYVTLGGAIANDVHGKNHHRDGSFGRHVLQLALARCDGSALQCSAAENPDWLEATIGGLGLTGVIVSARIQLQRVPGPWLDTDTAPFVGLQAFFALARESEASWQYTVAWIDCTGPRDGVVRGVFFRANHADASTAAARRRHNAQPRQRRVPFVPPVSLFNAATLPLLNTLYFAAQRHHSGRRIQHWQPFFYPLDNVLDWNRIYGPRGFFQYQCVLPRADEAAATAALLAEIRAAGVGSALAVLKTFGEQPAAGLLSFPQAGTTLALDFPNQGESTLALFDRLDHVVDAAGGRQYAAKDARMSRASFERGYPRLADFLPYRDPGLSSALSRRLLGS